VALIRQAGDRAVFQKTDVSKPADVRELVDKAVAEFGRLDVAFNNAGIDGEQVPLHEQDIDKAGLLFDVNIKGVFYSMKYEIEQMLKTGGGSIVNTSSIFGLNGYPGWSLYVATKHAVTGMNEGGGSRLRQAERPSECCRPRPGGDAAAGKGNGRRPAQLRRLRPDGADRPAGRDR
jgi:NAD(P)-dependent dehydrogenase (short-subunit alcohol dehydrogenase family)